MTEPGARSRGETAALVATLVAVLLVFTPAFGCGFTTWDDPAFCSQNPDVARPDLLRIFDPTHWVVSDWTPLATVTYAAERALFGTAPWVPHATNVLLHVLAVWLVQRLLRDLGFGPWESLGVALLYGVHPLQVESVAWVSSRKGCLVAVFSLAFLRAYLAGHHVRATGWFALALCSKATAVGLPIAAAAAHWMTLGAARRRTTWAWIGGWLVLSAGRAWVSIAAQAGATARTAVHGFSGRMAYMGSVLTKQVRQVAAPTNLSIVYDPPRRAWDDPILLAQWAVVLAILAGCALLARRERRLAWVGVFGLLMLAPTLNVFPGPAFQADRYVHLPMIAVGAMLVAALRPLARLQACVPAVLFLAWTLAVCVPRTLERLAVWRSDETLFADACRKTPTARVGWSQLGVVYASQGDLRAAIPLLRRAHEIEPDDTSTSLNLALALFGDGDDAGCERVVRSLLERTPDEGEAHGLLGCLHARAGRLDEASAEFSEGMRLAPQSQRVRAWFNQFAAAARGVTRDRGAPR